MFIIRERQLSFAFVFAFSVGSVCWRHWQMPSALLCGFCCTFFIRWCPFRTNEKRDVRLTDLFSIVRNYFNVKIHDMDSLQLLHAGYQQIIKQRELLQSSAFELIGNNCRFASLLTALSSSQWFLGFRNKHTYCIYKNPCTWICRSLDPYLHTETSLFQGWFHGGCLVGHHWAGTKEVQLCSISPFDWWGAHKNWATDGMLVRRWVSSVHFKFLCWKIWEAFVCVGPQSERKPRDVSK